ncbi:helix-turn-helix domain-containing protein [Streptomyces sp. NPDC058442]|uniref:helix-turn-helix domain-containing protein n=1 Tax=Streptomyces sp. NPDC058442 TaxID=3346503 RepID=UPI003662824C
MPDWAVARQREIGERIRITRGNAGMSQVQLGERIDRDHKTIHRWETTQGLPNLLDLLLLSDTLDIPLVRLVD